MAKFYAVRDADRDRLDIYAVAAMSDQIRPGYTDMYRWVPDFNLWVLDHGLKKDFHSRPQDQLNIFEEISTEEAVNFVHDFPPFAAGWVLDYYASVQVRLTSSQLGLTIDNEGQSISDPSKGLFP